MIMTDFTQKQIEKDETDRVMYEVSCAKYMVDIQEIHQAIAIIEKATSVEFDANHLLNTMFTKTLKEGRNVSFTGMEFYECLSDDQDEAFIENLDMRRARAVFTQVMRNLYASVEIIATLYGLPVDSMEFACKLSDFTAILVCKLEDHIHA